MFFKSNFFFPLEKCDLFTGHWVPELRSSLLYSNSSCVTIPDSKNCFGHGRRDMDFLNWKWKPENCELPSFDAKRFLEMSRGKKMAFVGDSVARNHIESLLCLLSQVTSITLSLFLSSSHIILYGCHSSYKLYVDK